MCHLDEFLNIFLKPSRSHCILSRPTFNTEKEEEKEKLGRTFGVYAQYFVLQDLSFNIRLRYDEVLTVPI